ncbi:hypothetical protein [Microbacterium resistens]|uniref:hypothetical protein n=1 Tax=Microbacterium resistens TaxID=156977 RepID=UPI00083094D4|nr:hypothetical protein [Microbacterium resistens]
MQTAALVCTVITAGAITVLARDPGAGDRAASGLLTTVAFAGAAVAGAASLPQIIVQRRRRRAVDEHLRLAREDWGVDPTLIERALRRQGLRPDPREDAAWSAACAALPAGSDLAELCARFGLGTATVWVAGDPDRDQNGE